MKKEKFSATVRSHDGKRISVTADTQEELTARVEAVRRIQRDIAAGLRPEEAAAVASGDCRLRPATLDALQAEVSRQRASGVSLLDQTAEGFALMKSEMTREHVIRVAALFLRLVEGEGQSRPVFPESDA